MSERYWELRWRDEYAVNQGLRDQLARARELLEAAYPLISDAIYQPVTKPAIKVFLDKIDTPDGTPAASSKQDQKVRAK
jgi:hypothetical protein